MAGLRRMMYAETAAAVAEGTTAFTENGGCGSASPELEEAGDELFQRLRFPIARSGAHYDNNALGASTRLTTTKTQQCCRRHGAAAPLRSPHERFRFAPGRMDALVPS